MWLLARESVYRSAQIFFILLPAILEGATRSFFRFVASTGLYSFNEWMNEWVLLNLLSRNSYFCNEKKLMNEWQTLVNGWMANISKKQGGNQCTWRMLTWYTWSLTQFVIFVSSVFVPFIVYCITTEILILRELWSVFLPFYRDNLQLDRWLVSYTLWFSISSTYLALNLSIFLLHITLFVQSKPG